MKKYIIYIVILVVGLILGKFLFGNSSSDKTSDNHTNETVENQMWTCSMHPQIMQPESGDCPICGMDLIPAETNADGLEANQFKLSTNALALANIQTTVIGTSTSASGEVKLSGKIVENESNLATQTAHFGGRIEKLYINSEGEKVNRGQLLARIYSPELFAAQQELLTAASLKESQPALYKAVRGKLKLWKLSEKQINSIEASKKPISNFPVYANVSGIVTEKIVEEGNHVMEGAPLLKIANLNTVWANFDVYENQLGLFKKGQKILITTNAYADKKFKAKVSFIDPILNTKTRTVILRAVLPNKNGIFKPGMFVEGKLSRVKSTKKEVLSVPATAVLWTGKRSVVYIKPNPNEPVFEMREVVLGSKSGTDFEVVEGLEKGEEIVTNGTFTVDAAAQLKGKKSMMNKEGGKTMTGHEGHNMNDNNEEMREEKKEIKKLIVTEKFQDQFKTVFDAYINLKDALVKDDATSVTITASTLLKNLAKVDMKLLKDNNAHQQWMNIEKEVKNSSNALAKTSVIKEQRNHFIQLSKQMTKAVQLFGVNQKVYNQFCPMAADNKGAYWLSYNKEIRNPYFGESMLSCGEVKATY